MKFLAPRSFVLLLVLGLSTSLAAQNVQHGPSTVRSDIHHDVSPPLRELIRNAPPPPTPEEEEAEPVRPIPLPFGWTQLSEDPIRQRTITPSSAVVGLSFEGLGQGQYNFYVTSAPPDTDGAVGSTQYVQWVNTWFAIFDKATGRLLAPPKPGSTLWLGFGGGCEGNNDGDVIALYDKLANRWVMSQFSVKTQPYLQCVAVSTSSDALGSWYRYAFQYSYFDDYPKMGVWPDAYYETFNMFLGNQFIGADACAYDRSAMLNGQSATQICFQQDPSVGGLLPADVDGIIPPPAGSPNYMLDFGFDNLNLFQFHVDFNNPANSTFIGPTVINVAAFSPLCGGGTCIPQPGTSNSLDSLADRLMYRLAYRNFGSHESLAVNHSVAVNGSGGVRWYELENPGGSPFLAQQGTYAPDSTYRWMGSVAMDNAGDLAVGYSKSSHSLYPSIAFAGRVPNDPAGTLEAETEVVDGSGSQTGTLHRWGDYSAMTVDSGDDCTFWYTQEYIQFNGTFNWNTRIVNFKFPNCSPITHILSVSKSGTGTGTVTSSDGLINCGQVCSATYNGNTQVTLIATPSQDSDFTAWSGCDSVNGNSCTVTMYKTRTVTATFTYHPVYYTLVVIVNGNGTVTSTDGFINCPGTCQHSYLQNTPVTLNANPAQGWTFAAWGGGNGVCSGNGPCNLIVNNNIILSAAFTDNLGIVTTLYSFCAQPNCPDGTAPDAGLVQGFDGNFYGTTQSGGGTYGSGTVFRITPSGNLTTLYTLCSQPYCADGQSSQAELVQGTDGNFYGTTYSGGAHSAGTVFKATPAGALTTLHSFNGNDGANPEAGLVQGTDGNFYGTTSSGGTGQNCFYGCGTVFKLTPNGTLTTLHTFCAQQNCADGYQPRAGLVQGADGNFYGTTIYGGAGLAGTVFRITPGGTLTTLYTFSGADGAYPIGGLIQATNGNFYGTTWQGGLNSDQSLCPNGCGTVFKITSSGTLTTLYNFCSQMNCADGNSPWATLVQATDSNLYGTTTRGGTGIFSYGTIFRITPSGTLTTLYSFCSQSKCADGLGPSRLVQSTDGTFYGTTFEGGAYDLGAVFRFSVGLTPIPMQFVPVTPCRLVDTRNAPGEFSGPSLQANTIRNFIIPDNKNCSVPANAAAYSLNVTVQPQGELGYLTVWPTGRTQPYVSTLNSYDGRIKANAAIVLAGASGAVSFYVTNTTDLILDIDGYFAPANQSTMAFYPLTPCRIADTRNTNGDLGGPYLKGEMQRDFPILEATSCLPKGVNPTAYSLNFTAIPHGELWFLTVWPTGQEQPDVSTLNSYGGQITANAAIVQAGAGGEVSAYVTQDTDLIIDINGYFGPPGPGGLSLYPVMPCRVLDTRPPLGNGAFQGTLSPPVDLRGSVCAVPSPAQSYVLNATVQPPAPFGFLTLWPDGQDKPWVSTLNAYDGMVSSNMAIVPAGTAGKIDASASDSTQLILDIFSYFAP